MGAVPVHCAAVSQLLIASPLSINPTLHEYVATAPWILFDGTIVTWPFAMLFKRMHCKIAVVLINVNLMT